MTVPDAVTLLLLAPALFFFVAGTVGLIRFPDLYSRLHALTKADNVGLGLTVLALTFQAESWIEVFKLGLIWILVLVSSATVCFLIGHEAFRRGRPRLAEPGRRL
jgi:multicomponent Na+:H+ antiporter subunit G